MLTEEGTGVHEVRLDRQRRAYTPDEWAVILEAAKRYGLGDPCPNDVVKDRLGDPDIYVLNEDGSVLYRNGAAQVHGNDGPLTKRQTQMLATVALIAKHGTAQMEDAA